MMPDGSLGLLGGFVTLSTVVFAIVAYALSDRKAVVAMLAWVVVVSALASSGLLAHFNPPRPLLVFVPTLIGVVILFRRCKEQLLRFSFAMLIAFQAFRIVVEILIHQAVVEGIAPPQMSWYPGLNQDVITGVAALLLAPFASRAPRWLLHAYNVIGAGLLLWVVGVAVLSMPTPLQQIEPDNVWVAYFPYVLLPVVLVSAALLGHLTLYLKLRTAPLTPLS